MDQTLQDLDINIAKEKLDEVSARRLARKELIKMISQDKKAEIFENLTKNMFSRRKKEEIFHPLSNEELSVVEEVIEKHKNSKSFTVVSEKSLELFFNYVVLRYDYLTGKNIVSSTNFRKASKIITDNLVEFAKEAENLDFVKTIVVLPWRAGLTFAESVKKANFKNIYHIGIVRNEKTLEAEIYFEQFPIILDRENKQENVGLKVLICDPMLATGGTILNIIWRLKLYGILEKNIIILSIISAPEGIFNIFSNYPEVKIYVGEYDEKLDAKGYIFPGLGDFGDKYFSQGIEGEIQKWSDLMILNAKATAALKLRMTGKKSPKDFRIFRA